MALAAETWRGRGGVRLGRRPRRDRDLGQPPQHVVAFRELLLQLLGHLARRCELLAEILVDVANGVLEAADRALGDFGRRDQFRDRRLQRMLVRLQALQPGVQQHAIADREHQQNRHQALDHNSE